MAQAKINSYKRKQWEAGKNNMQKKRKKKKRKFIGYTQRKDHPMCVAYICAKSHIFSVICIFFTRF